ncbi:MAG: hypothetical protein LBD08_08430 [Treponema sp.]|jgi:hypothetical protein|nr:hypothetical protein [Treponema sp.]
MKQAIALSLLLLWTAVWAAADDLPPADEPPVIGESAAGDATPPADEQPPAVAAEPAAVAETPAAAAGKKTASKGLKDRTVEFGVLVDVGAANNFVSANDFFRETAVINLNRLGDALKLDVNANITPFFFNFNWKDRWGFGLFVNAEAAGHISLSGNLLRFNHAIKDHFGAGSAVFAEGGVWAAFPVKNFKIRLRPAYFMPVIYLEPDISYTHITRNGGYIQAQVIYDIKVYAAHPLEALLGEDGAGFDMAAFSLDSISGAGGVDLGLGLDYIISPDLTLGVDFTHVPLVPARLKDYMRLQGDAGINTDDLLGGMDGGGIDSLITLPEMNPVYGADSKEVLRPFKANFFLEFRPEGTRSIALIPSLGFAINPLFVGPFSLEGGLRVRGSLANILNTAIGVHYTDRLWKNSLDLAFNLRVFELGIGLSLQSQDFIKSWAAAGLGVSLGLKFGW